MSKHWQWVLPQLQLFCLYFHKYSSKQARLWNSKPSADLTSLALVQFLPAENFAGQCLAHPLAHQRCRTLTEVFWSCALWMLTPESRSHWLRKQPQHNLATVPSIKLHSLSPASQSSETWGSDLTLTSFTAIPPTGYSFPFCVFFSRYDHAAVRSLQSHLFTRLNKTHSLSLSSRASAPDPHYVGGHHASSSTSFLYWQT